MRIVSVIGFCVALTACAPTPPPTQQRAALSQGFVSQAVAFLDGLQPRSIAENREYCGYFGRDGSGAFVASTPKRGGSDFCDLDISEHGYEVLASYHTHAAFDTDTFNEVPSDVDLLSDMGDDVYGFVATPGGRIWLTNPDTRSARQLCGIGCVTSDPQFIRGDAGPIAQSYTLRELRRQF